jgi:hypothetical protein
MDHSRFDAITKGFAASSRRSLLGIAGVSALAAWLGWDPREADAKPKKKCKKPKSKCGKKCINLKTDEQNCGACGKKCGAGQTCSNGDCVGGGCGPGLRDCGAAGCKECCPNENFGYCCPPGRPNCAFDFGNEHYKRCSPGGTCECPSAFPDECIWNPNTPDHVCWECCGDETCINDDDGPSSPFVQGRLVCRQFGCDCPDGQKLCPNINPAPDEPGTWCAELDSDPENCGDCGNRCIFGLATRCFEGHCVE